MKQIFTWIGKSVETHEVAAGFFALFSLLTTLVGIFRERLLATMVGPGPVLDAYVIGHKIPDFLYATTASMVSVTILLPFISREISDEIKKKRFSQIGAAYGYFSSILSLVLIATAPLTVPLIASGAPVETIHYAISITQVLLIAPILMGLSNIFVSIAQSEKRFIATSMAPFIYNCITVISMFVLYPLLGPVGLGLAIVVAAAGHMVVTLSAAWQGKYRPLYIKKIEWSYLYNLFSIAIPRTFSVSMSVISSIVVVYFAARLDSGSLSLYNIAIVIQNVPVTIIGVALATSVFPDLVSAYNKGNTLDFSFIVTKTLRLMFLASFVSVVLFFLLNSEIVAILFGGGKFTSEYIATTAQLVALFSFGIVAQCIIQLTARIYYARGDTWKPFRQSILGLVVTLAMLLYVSANFSITLSDIVLCLIAGWWVNAIVALGLLIPVILTRSDRSTLRLFLGKILVLTTIVTICTLYIQKNVNSVHLQFSAVFDSQIMTATFLSTVVIGGVFVILYILGLFLLRIDEIYDLKTFIVSKLKK